MKSRYLALIPIILLAIALIPLAVIRNEMEEISPATPHTRQKIEIPPYTTRPASPDGIGKVFMGREISKVMGHPGIGWLERTDREKEEAPSKAIALLNLPRHAVIADIGAGSGYYSFRIASRIPEGKVIAVDIETQMLRFLKNEAEKHRLTNVVPHLGTIESVNLAPNTIDAAILVDAYHEFSHPAEMLRSIHSALKPGGIIYLLEFRAEDPRVPIKTLHKMSAEQAIKEFETLGFSFVENKPDLPWQHFLIFKKP